MSEKKTKSLIIRIDEDLHKKMRHNSIEQNISLNQYVVNAFEKIVKEYEGKANDKKLR